MDIEISIVPFRYKMFSYLLDMLASQKYPGIVDIKFKTLPKIGYLALYNGYPVAAGFLRRVEGNIAQLDGLTSNAYLGSIIRHKGISAVVDELIKDAKRLKLDGIIAHTKDQGVLKRAADLGFHEVSQTIIALPLKS